MSSLLESETVKLKTVIILMTIATTLGWQAGAQLIEAPANLRDVDGALYYIDQDALWENLQGDVLNVSTNAMALSTFTMEPIYEATTKTGYVPTGEFSPDREVLVPTKVEVGKKQVPGKKIVLRNYPKELYPAVGQSITFRAMRVGTAIYNGDTLELWDYGTKPTQEELKKLKDEVDARQKAAEELLEAQRRAAAEKAAAAKMAAQAKIVKSNQELADKGDPYGLLRMGELYRDGNGVPKDLTKARDYLTKAAAAGSPSAAAELSKLNQASTNSPATQ
jgi:hypothetical protein